MYVVGWHGPWGWEWLGDRVYTHRFEKAMVFSSATEAQKKAMSIDTVMTYEEAQAVDLAGRL